MTVSRRPRRLGALLSLAVATAAIATVAAGPSQREALWVGGGGATLLWGGLRWRSARLAGVAVALVGLAAVTAGLALAVVGPDVLVESVEVAPGVLGLALLAAGLAPLGWPGKRLLVSAGTGLVFACVLASAAVFGAGTLALLAAGAATVVSWDVAEQAINLGEQVGEAAVTTRAELVHGGATAAVGAGAVGLTTVVDGAGPSGLSLVGVLFLLAAAVTLTVVLYN